MENSDEFNREVGGWVGGAVVEEIMYVLSRWAEDQFNLIFCEEKQEGLGMRRGNTQTYIWGARRPRTMAAGK